MSFCSVPVEEHRSIVAICSPFPHVNQWPASPEPLDLWDPLSWWLPAVGTTTAHWTNKGEIDWGVNCVPTLNFTGKIQANRVYNITKFQALLESFRSHKITLPRGLLSIYLQLHIFDNVDNLEIAMNCLNLIIFNTCISLITSFTVFCLCGILYKIKYSITVYLL